MTLQHLLIGTNLLTNKPVFLKAQDRVMHTHIIGTTGAGKSKLMEYMIRSDIDQRKGLCLIDPHGDLYQNILKYITRKRLNKKVILIDPNDEDWAVGLNYLEHDPNTTNSTTHASEVMKGIAKVFGGENIDTLPRLQRWERNALIPLIEQQLTLIELSDFVNPTNPILRKTILKQTTNYHLIQEWEEFENRHPRDRATYIEAIQNRANKFTIGQNIRRIFGQTKTTINFRQAMDEQKIILCNLASNKLSKEEQKMLGVVITDKILQAGKARADIPENKRKQFYFYLDEFGQFVSEDIAVALQELRKYKISLILAHQELDQLKQDSPKVYSAVMSEPQIRISFRISREDAEILAKEMFTGKIRGDIEKRRIEQTKFQPIETTRGIQTNTDTWSDTQSDSRTTGRSIGTTTIPNPIFLEPDKITYTEIDTNTFAAGNTSSSGGSLSYSTVPWYEYIPFKEVSTIQDYSIEEITEKYIAWIKNQPDRNAQVKIRQNPPIPIVTPTVKSLPVRQKDIDTLKQQSYQQYALPATKVDQLIEQRRITLLELKQEQPPEEEPESWRE